MTAPSPSPTSTNSSAAPAEDPETGDSSLFDQALARYQAGAAPEDLIDDFLAITAQAPRQSASWTCLAWLQLLLDQPRAALQSARIAVRLNPQDPQARINLSLALLETGGKGVREHVELVQRVMLMAPELAEELRGSIADGLQRRPGWGALSKLRSWLEA
jgi:predicted Zn-dependent protease